MNLPYTPTHDVKWLDSHLRTNYYTKKYDRFMWWRSYTLRNPPLSNRHPLRERISNGDFDLGPYTFEIELVEHKLNEKHRLLGHDPVQLSVAVQMDKARRKRLQEDRDKDKFNKLQELKKYFLFEFKITKAQYDREIVRYTGPDLINFYYRMEDKYKKYARVTKSSPKLKS